MSPPINIPSLAVQQDVYHEYMAHPYIVGLIITATLMLAALALRIYAQWLIKNLSAWDNILTMLAFASLVPLNFFTAWQFSAGAGYHIWRVIEDDYHAPYNVRTIFISWYWCTIFAAQSSCWIKLAMLMFIKRVLPCDIRAFRLAWWIILILTVMVMIGSTIEFALACQPVSWFWNRVVLAFAPTSAMAAGVTPGSCMPLPLYLQIPLIASFITDVLLFLLPLIPLWNMLNLTLYKKISVFLTLSLGLFAIAIDIVRIYEVVHFELMGDVTWLNTPGVAWNAIEYNVALVAACVPAMAPLLRRELWQRGPFRRKGFHNPPHHHHNHHYSIDDGHGGSSTASNNSTKNLIYTSDYRVWGDREGPWRRQSDDTSLWSEDTRTNSRAAAGERERLRRGSSAYSIKMSPQSPTPRSPPDFGKGHGYAQQQRSRGETRRPSESTIAVDGDNKQQQQQHGITGHQQLHQHEGKHDEGEHELCVLKGGGVV